MKKQNESDEIPPLDEDFMKQFDDLEDNSR